MKKAVTSSSHKF